VLQPPRVEVGVSKEPSHVFDDLSRSGFHRTEGIHPISIVCVDVGEQICVAPIKAGEEARCG
jgi:hypothetical protein